MKTEDSQQVNAGEAESGRNSEGALHGAEADVTTRKRTQAPQARRTAAGRRVVVDIDLEKTKFQRRLTCASRSSEAAGTKFFDRVNHDLLMQKLSLKIDDGRVLRLIRRYLEAGMMAQGIVSPRTQGTPQGGPLSPLLSNILLTELDRELQRRGHAFCRYADDCNIDVKSKAAGERVMASITRFLTEKLKLKCS